MLPTIIRVYLTKSLHSKHYLKYWMSADIPLYIQLFHYFLKWNILMLLCFDLVLLYLLDQFFECLIRVYFYPIDLYVNKQSNQILRLGKMSIRNRSPRHDVGLMAIFA